MIESIFGTKIYCLNRNRIFDGEFYDMKEVNQLSHQISECIKNDNDMSPETLKNLKKCDLATCKYFNKFNHISIFSEMRFLFTIDNKIVSYLDVYSYEDKDCVYYANVYTLKEFRGLGYTHVGINKITDYLLKYNVNKFEVDCHTQESLNMFSKLGWLIDANTEIENPTIYFRLTHFNPNCKELNDLTKNFVPAKDYITQINLYLTKKNNEVIEFILKR